MIEIRKLEKSFGRLQVLRGLDLQFQEGRITAIAGPNASGKTTLIKILLGLVKPDGGEVIFRGVPLNGDCGYRSQIGYMPQYAHFPENLTGRDLLAMIKDLRRSEQDVDEELIEEFSLQDQLDKPLKTLSGGTRQKVSAVIAFLFRPQVLILDEPTAGLDPISSSRLKKKILKERDRGRMILLTSHILSEIDELADQLVFLLEGKAYFNGPLLQLKTQSQSEPLERAVARLMEGVAA